MKIWPKASELKKGNKYDCVIGLSGGFDSSLLAHLVVKEWGLNPLALTFDNGFNSMIAEQNINGLVRGLNLDYKVIQPDKIEYLNVTRAMFYAGVPDVDMPADLAFLRVLWQGAKENNCPLLLGHNAITEKSPEPEWSYCDDVYLSDILDRFKIVAPSLPRFPVEFWRECLDSGIRRYDPFDELNWPDFVDIPALKNMLAENYGWQEYGLKHTENRLTGLVIYSYLPTRFGIKKWVKYGYDRNLIITFTRMMGYLNSIMTYPEYQYICALPPLDRELYKNNHQYFKDNAEYFKDKVPANFYRKNCL